MGLFQRLFPDAEEKELAQLKCEYRHAQIAVEKRELRGKLQFALSRHRQLKEAESIEYQRAPAPAPEARTLMMRFPCYEGEQFQFNAAGQTTEYPFRESENWQPVRFETGDEFFRRSDDLGWLMGWSPISLGLGGQFPREMMPGSLASIRVMTGLDLLRFQSKIMFETISPYSGVVNHLCNYVCGDKGATVVASSKTDKKLAQDLSDYLEQWAISISFLNKVRGCCNQLLVQGECLPRRWRDSRVTLTDPSWLRGPHNEIGQNPWSYGILSPNWPFEVDTIGAYHLWYPSNEHETLSPQEVFHGRLDSSVGPSAKRSVPLSYRIRPLLPLLESLISELASGEVKRQKIAGVISKAEGADKARFIKRGVDSPFAGSMMDLGEPGGPEGFGGLYNAQSGYWEVNAPVKVESPPAGTAAAQSGCQAYDKVATVAANAIGVASWMMGSDFQEASRATSLTASEPTVKTGKNLQRVLCECWQRVAEAECLLTLEETFPPDMFKKGTVKIHIELPNVEVRDMNELYDRLSKQMSDGLKSPQHVASEMGDDFEEETELIEIAKANGWQSPSDRAMAEATAGKGDEADERPASSELKLAAND